MERRFLTLPHDKKHWRPSAARFVRDPEVVFFRTRKLVRVSPDESVVDFKSPMFSRGTSFKVAFMVVISDRLLRQRENISAPSVSVWIGSGYGRVQIVLQVFEGIEPRFPGLDH